MSSLKLIRTLDQLHIIDVGGILGRLMVNISRDIQDHQADGDRTQGHLHHDEAPGERVVGEADHLDPLQVKGQCTDQSKLMTPDIQAIIRRLLGASHQLTTKDHHQIGQGPPLKSDHP